MERVDWKVREINGRRKKRGRGREGEKGRGREGEREKGERERQHRMRPV